MEKITEIQKISLHKIVIYVINKVRCYRIMNKMEKGRCSP
jgi:hypothetical protein